MLYNMQKEELHKRHRTTVINGLNEGGFNLRNKKRYTE